MSLLLGWSQKTITPDQPVLLAGQFHRRISTGVHTPCEVTALVMEGNSTKGEREILIFVSLEVVSIEEELLEKVRQQVAAGEPEIPVERILITCTHTHTAPCTRYGMYDEPGGDVISISDTVEFVARQTANAILEAWRQRTPGSLSRSWSQAAIGYNRRAVYLDGSSVMYGSTNRPDFVRVEGSVDHDVEVLFFFDEDQSKPSGLFVNVACPAQVVEGLSVVSADYYGDFRAMARELWGDDLMIIATLSAAGDQSPRNLVRRGREEPNMRSFEGCREMARRLLAAVEDAWKQRPVAPDANPSLGWIGGRFPLSRRMVSPEEKAANDKAIAHFEANPPEPGSKDEGEYLREQRVTERAIEQQTQPKLSFELHAVRIGDTLLATNPFELFLEFGQRIEARSPAPQTILCQLTNGTGFYLPTHQAVQGGGYSGRIRENRVGPEGGDELVALTLEWFNSLMPGENS